MEHHDILIVDDEERYATMLASRLGLRGFSCKVRNDGQTAIDIIKTLSFSWVILDLRLPDIYGSEVLSQIKTTAPQTQVIILTGHGTDKDRVQCLERGAHSFMNKPLDIDQMISIMGQNKEHSI
ncbi:MAG: response regulator [Desulfobacter sp.]|nr:MAG: response regulator [Desulfobacter sp.]